MSLPSTERFSGRVANYIRYRPDYPPAVLSYLKATCGGQPGVALADIGSGTGIFTRHLLAAGYTVYAVEPNAPMRAAAEDLFAAESGFHSIDGSAANTGLAARSMDGIVCAQAFHWFNTPETKEEFRRILKPGGCVALIWNNRRTWADAFAEAYEHLLQRLSPDYAAVNHQNLSTKDFEAFFRDGQYQYAAFPNEQLFDEAGLKGRAFSSSYVPAADTPAGKAFAAELSGMFRQYQEGGKLRFLYDTEVYSGSL